MAAGNQLIELAYRRSGTGAAENGQRAALALIAVALGPPLALGGALLTTGFDSRATGCALLMNLFGALIGPPSAVIAFLLAGSGYRRTRQVGLPATKYPWLQALAVVAFLSSCAGGFIVAWIARGFR